jgi:hypothetical protein
VTSDAFDWQDDYTQFTDTINVYHGGEYVIWYADLQAARGM